MALYINTTVIEASQWFKNGDHPEDRVGEKAVDWGKVAELRPDLLDKNEPVKDEDIPDEAYYKRIEGAVVRYFRLPPPGPRGIDIHEACGVTYHNHGWIDTPPGISPGGYTVCPGDWIITYPHTYQPVKPAIFEVEYSLIEIHGIQEKDGHNE